MLRPAMTTPSLPPPAGRDATVDVARGLGIVLVVLGHNPQVLHEPGLLFRAIYAMHMPLFLFLSGLFLPRPEQPLRQVLASRADALLKPFLVVALTVEAVVRLLPPALTGGWQPEPLAESLAGVLRATGATLRWEPLWFLPHLFLVSVLAAVLAARITGAACAVLALALLPAGLRVMQAAPAGTAGWPWSLDLLPLSLGFVLLGHAARRLPATLQQRPTHQLLALALACAAGFALLLAGSSGGLDMNRREAADLPRTLLLALTGIGLALLLAALLVRARAQRPWTRLGTASLPILIFHGFSQAFVHYHLLRRTGSPALAALGGFTAGLAVPLLVEALTRRSALLAAALLPLRRVRSRP